MEYIEVKGLTKIFGKDVVAVDNANFSLKNGEFISLLGPSGCGKSTILNMISGLIEPTEAEIFVAEKCFFSHINKINVPAEKREMGMVFQDFALWPHMNVFENVAFGLRLRKVPSVKIEKKVLESLELVQLAGFEKRLPKELSGGQQQRVAFARAIVISPKVLLLDEPLSALDAKLREEMREEITNLVHKLNITTIYVTHDQVEALTMSDRMFVMDQGKILREGTPLDVYKDPQVSFVAAFIGKSNFIQGQYQKDTDDAMIKVNKNLNIKSILPKVDIEDGQKVSAVLRPEKIKVTESVETESHTNINILEGKLLRSVFLGDIYETYFQVDDNVVFKVPMEKEYPAGNKYYLMFHKEDVKILIK
ncbi:MAG: ABC transporter ATP-binding protein [Deltaproteobacteria bacterium]|nr:ABC transporter ATP-binding protein [Deltaproteobacteria bacterium]